MKLPRAIHGVSAATICEKARLNVWRLTPLTIGPSCVIMPLLSIQKDSSWCIFTLTSQGLVYILLLLTPPTRQWESMFFLDPLEGTETIIPCLFRQKKRAARSEPPTPPLQRNILLSFFGTSQNVWASGSRYLSIIACASSWLAMPSRWMST